MDTAHVFAECVVAFGLVGAERAGELARDAAVVAEVLTQTQHLEVPPAAPLALKRI